MSKTVLCNCGNIAPYTSYFKAYYCCKCGFFLKDAMKHEDEINCFDLENFKKELKEWHDFIIKDLKNEPYDLHLRCVDDVLGSIECMIEDNTLYKDE